MRNLLLSLPQNIFEKINYLKQDYIGLNLDYSPFINLFLGFLISLGIIIVSLLIGRKLRKAFLGNQKIINAEYLIDIGLGYALIATGTGLLGMFSLLKPEILWTYIFLCIAIAFFPFTNLKSLLNQITSFLPSLYKDVAKNRFVFIWVILFILIAVINLINPEIREDQYHVDFPKMYINQQTIMVPPRESFHVSASPMLSEMTYMLGIFLWSEESARYIHFLFYIFVLLTLYEFSKIKGYEFTIFTPLLFVTAPVVLHETSSMYTDFQWIFFFLLSLLLLVKNKKLELKTIILSGFLIGGMLSVKLWTIVFIPATAIFLIYTLSKSSFKARIKYTFLFLATSLITPAIWLLRAYLLTGNPLWPAFIHETSLDNSIWNLSISHYVAINYPLFNPFYILNIVSPLFYIGCVGFIFKLKNNFYVVKKHIIFKLLFIFIMLYAFINYPFGRYLFGLYVLIIFFSSVGLDILIKSSNKIKLLINVLLFSIFAYYIVNSLLVFPYAIGYANKNNYLTRTISKGNLGYYDFDKKFDKFISDKDLVATYNVGGYYYANFNYIDINSILDKSHKSFAELKKAGVTKLFIKNGDINWFCKMINLSLCDPSSYSLISSYTSFPGYYLYKIR